MNNKPQVHKVCMFCSFEKYLAINELMFVYLAIKYLNRQNNIKFIIITY